MSVVTLNGVTEEDLGLEVPTSGPLGAVWSGPGQARPSVGVLGRYGAVPAAVGTGEAKAFTLGLALPTSLSGRRAALNTVLRHLDGLIRVQWEDSPGLHQWARLDMVGVEARWQQLAFHTTAADLLLPLTFVLDSPCFESNDISVIAVSSTAARVPLGNYPSEVVFRVNGAIADPMTITVRHGVTGEIVVKLTTGATTPASTVLTVDGRRSELWTWVDSTGVVVDQLDALYDDAVADNDFPYFDPKDGNPALELWPTVECSHSGLVTAYYRRVW